MSYTARSLSEAISLGNRMFIEEYCKNKSYCPIHIDLILAVKAKNFTSFVVLFNIATEKGKTATELLGQCSGLIHDHFLDKIFELLTSKCRDYASRITADMLLQEYKRRYHFNKFIQLYDEAMALGKVSRHGTDSIGDSTLLFTSIMKGDVKFVREYYEKLDAKVTTCELTVAVKTEQIDMFDVLFDIAIGQGGVASELFYKYSTCEWVFNRLLDRVRTRLITECKEKAQYVTVDMLMKWNNIRARFDKFLSLYDVAVKLGSGREECEIILADCVRDNSIAVAAQNIRELIEREKGDNGLNVRFSCETRICDALGTIFGKLGYGVEKESVLVVNWKGDGNLRIRLGYESVGDDVEDIAKDIQIKINSLSEKKFTWKGDARTCEKLEGVFVRSRCSVEMDSVVVIGW